MFAKKAAATATVVRHHSPVRRAVAPVLEALEQRCLMSAALSLTNLDGLPFSNRLFFNKIQNLDPKFPNVTHDTSSLKISNTGDATLNINALTVTGPWTFVNGPTTFPVAIPVGGSTTLTLKFTQSTLPRHAVNETNFTTNPNGGAAITGSLVIQSNDPAHVNTPVQLAGYWQSKSENNAEPNLTTIVNLLGGYTTNIGGSPDLPEPGSTPVRFGDEVLSDFWQSANAAQPVVVRQLAGFHTQGNVVHTFWFTGGSTGLNSTVSHQLFSSKPLEGQSLLPHSAAGTFATGSFTTSSPFGLRVDTEYSLNSLNSTGGGGHHFRFYPVLDQSGTVVPNTWIVGMDYAVIQTENFDFQDNVYIVSNMMPAQVQTVVPPPTPTNFTATNVANPVLNWTGITDPNPFGYKVYRGTSASGPFTLISGASPLSSSTTTFTDNASPPAGQLFYRLTAVDIASGVESVPATASANAPAANVPVAVNDTFDTTTNATNVTVDVTANDTGLDVSRPVTIVSAPNHGGTAVPDPNNTGLVTYTPAAGFTGVETFTYRVANGATQSNVATVTFNVSQPVVPSPALPVAGDQNFQELAASSFTLMPTTDTDAEGNPITPSSITIVANPTRGTVTTSGASIIYTPDPTKTAGANFVGSDSFTYDVTDSAGHTSTNHGTISLNVGVEFGTNTGKRSLTYTDISGSTPTATLNIGVADVFFSGNGQFTVDSHGRITVGSFSGASNLKISNVDLTNTNGASTFAILTPHNAGTFTVGGVVDSGTLNRIIAPNSIISGGSVASTTIDLGGVGVLFVGTVNNSIINIGTGFAAGPVVIAGVVTDSLMNADGAVRVIKVVSWTNTENANLGISAVSLGTLLVTGNANASGDFEPNLSLTGTGNDLNVASIAGTLDKGGWDINGNANVIVAKVVGAGWSGTVSGKLNTMVVRTGGMPAPLTVTNLNVLNVLAGDITGGIDVGAARVIRTAGAIRGASITSAGNIFALVADSLVSSQVTAGDVSVGFTDANPTAAGLGSAVISNVVLTSHSANAFSGSTIMAHTITTSRLGGVDTSKVGGMAAAKFSNVVLTIGTTNLHLGPNDLATAGDITSFKGTDFGNFRIRVLA